MPIYEYACRKCGKTAEYMQRMSDPPKRKCEHCGGQSLERVISQTSFQLKGSGWYKDLYSSPKPAASTEGKSDSGAGGGDAGSAGTSGGETSSTPSSDGGSSGAAAASKPASKIIAPKVSSKGTTRAAGGGRTSGGGGKGGKAKKGSR